MANEFRVKNGLIVGDLSVDSGGTLTIPDEIIHAGDTDTKIIFGTDTQGFQVNGNAIMGITDGQVTVDGSLTLKERSAAPADNDAYGQLWVKNTGTGQLFFTTDDGTDIQITTSSAVNASGGAANQTLTTGDGVSGANSGSDGDFTIAVEAAQTTITSLLATDIKIGEDDQTKIDFETADEIHFYAANVEQVYLADNIFGPQSDSDVDLGTTGVRWKDAFVDSITVTGAVTPASITLGGHTFNDIDIGTEHVDTDDHIMSSGAIKEYVDANGGASAIDNLSDAITTATSNIGLGSGALDSLTASSGNYNTALGINAGTAITTGDNSVAIGYNALTTATTQNEATAIGYLAGEDLAGGVFGSTAMGVRSLSNFTTGWGNTGVGHDALWSENGAGTGQQNTAIGYQAMKGAVGGGVGITGSFNVGLGSHANSRIADGTANVAVGHQSNNNVSSGSYNIGIGMRANQNVTTGSRNIAIGHEAMNGYDTENDNIAIGYDALGGSVAGGEYNVSIGNYSLDALTSADYNVAIGHNAGTLIQDGGSNVVIGAEAAGNGDIGANNVLVGMQSGYGSTDATQSVAIGNDAGKFGLKAATGSIAMGQNALKGHSSNTTGANYNTALGHYSMEDVTTGDDNTAVGSYSLKEITTGSTNIAIGHDAGDNITTGSHNVVIGGADVASATGDSQLSISSGGGGVTWITGTSDSGVLMGDGTIPNGSTAGQLTISNANADTFAHTLLLVDSEDDATNGPVLTLYRNTASPADNDILGKIQFNGEDSNGDARAYGNIRTESVDVTNGSHDGAMIFNTAIAGTQTDIFRIDTGVRAMIAGVVNITGTTTLSDEQSGSYVYVTGSGAPTLPPTAIAGQQFTLINNTGGNLTVGLGTSNAIASGWTAHAVMADETARTYFSPEANKWIYIG